MLQQLRLLAGGREACDCCDASWWETGYSPKLTRMGGSLAVGLVPVACATVMLRYRLETSFAVNDKSVDRLAVPSPVRWVAVAEARAPTRSCIPNGCQFVTVLHSTCTKLMITVVYAPLYAQLLPRVLTQQAPGTDRVVRPNQAHNAPVTHRLRIMRIGTLDVA
jgi:hypothetical protein